MGAVYFYMNIMNSFIDIFCVIFILFISSNTGKEIPAKMVEKAQKAFAKCDLDKEVGLTWKEVEKCEMLAPDLADGKITKDDFDKADLNPDGTLLYEEWEKYAMGDVT